MTVEQMLELRHETYLMWPEPWPACGPEGNELLAHVRLSASVHDCVNMQRRAAKAAGRQTMGEDEQHLLDFIAVHWAGVDHTHWVKNEQDTKTTRQ